ncbi:MAG: SDR family oxidoreductase [Desulfobacteraceae bacterium]|nr:SDR family oxidoreductase [Desulfobacteraceae bacterium]
MASRTILKAQIQTAAEHGYRAMAGSELEHFLFRNTYRQAYDRNYSKLDPAGWYLEDYHMLQGSREEDVNGAVRRHLRQSGIPVESSKGEWGRGQHEINIKYADALTTADRHVLYKQCLKEVADQLGCSVTFMAKYAADQAGSSAHIHLSLWNEEGNVFNGQKEFGPVRCSALFRWFLGGWLAHVSEFMVFYAPTINAYKRYQAGSWAPTRIAWSHDNRTAGFRVVGRGSSLRIECRIPGAVKVVFNNAGIMHGRDDNAMTTEEDVWDLTMAINLKGVFLGCKYGIPALKRAGGGSVINTASFVAILGAATPQIAYTASKGGVLAMTRELAVVHARDNIRVNALCPGPLHTELLMKFLNTEEKRQRRLVHIPMGRFGEAEEMARAALFLASDDASYITGTAFTVDGGITAAYVTPD